ncbi:hypothetical protein [Labrys wisconsinensis]|uniref:Uncharacterized protein n=1 Tax=Labrys wisconsinensis TaxID=425677 RepID=A0ABU0J4Q5_9HYPH|nr:hypothetical protein [Labrys wisconsinensis]MDQ0469219.1 hypothetical protein [Labrys wisconsinensis]
MTAAGPPEAALRPPSVVMRLDRLGTMHRTRLSFSLSLLRRMGREGWRFARPVWAIGPDGFGHAVYTVETPANRYSLVAFSRDLAPDLRTDRVIAEAWDTSYVLYDGVPDAAEIARLAHEVPLQEAGRFAARDLILSRANKSVRLFDAVVAALAAGGQPAAAMLDEVGYLMRTTAVYGNGKFGIADRDVLADRRDLSGPFSAEMLTVWLIRAFTVDLAEHCAAVRASGAARLAPALRRLLGVGNATGLGMAPFLVRHPMLLHRWILARERALARVRAAPVSDAAWQAFCGLLRQARAAVVAWRTQDEIQAARIAALARDLAGLAAEADGTPPPARSWDALHRFAEAHCDLEAQEYLVALLIEPHGPLVDDLAEEMGAEEWRGHGLDGTMTCAGLGALIERDYGWALAPPGQGAEARFWYVSEEKLEPRLGERGIEPGAERELPLTFARDARALHQALAGEPGARPVGDFVAARPAWRHMAQRVQLVAHHPYAEIRDNLVDIGMRPIDLLRCKLSFFGATRFDPRSDRWLRITLFQGAPFPDDPTDMAAEA